MKNVQFGESLTGDLSEETWTFEVKDLELRAGVFAIARKEDYEELIKERNLLKTFLVELLGSSESLNLSYETLLIGNKILKKVKNNN